MTTKILQDESVLLPEYLPDKLVDRASEFAQIVSNIRNRVNTLLIGPVGTGKTTLVRLARQRLGSECEVVYLDCTIYDTQYAALREILPQSKWILTKSVYELTKELAKVGKKRPLCVCFDNFVRLKEPELIRKVISLGICVILVGSVERDAAVLSENMLSNIPSIIRLRNYRTDEGLEIVRSRAEKALIPSSYSDTFLRALVEKSTGNIARALSLLRFVALEAESKKLETIDSIDLASFFTPLPQLNADEEKLLNLLKEKKNTSSKELFDSYRKTVAFPKGARCLRNYMRRLAVLGLVEAIGQNSGRIYVLMQPSLVGG